MAAEVELSTPGPLGIIAGSGGLPRRVIESCRAAGREVFVLALEGEADRAALETVPHAWCRIGAAGTALDLLRANAVGELVLAGGVLVKVEKPGQEKRADRPAIGPQTVTLAAESGLRGIAAEAGATLVLDRDEVVRLADSTGLFVVGIRSP